MARNSGSARNGAAGSGSNNKAVIDANALEAVKEEVARLQQELRETQKQLLALQQQRIEVPSKEEDERMKKQRWWTSLLRFVVFLVAIPIGLSIVCQRQYETLVERFGGTFFDGRVEYLLMFPLPSWKRHLLLSSPFLAEGPREVLERMPEKRDPRQVWYNSSVHDTSYRGLRTKFVDSAECARLRTLVSRHTLTHTNLNEDEESSLHKEFSHIPVYELLGMYDPLAGVTISKEEANLLIDVMNRIQQTVESQFNSPYILLDFADITRRTSPVEQQHNTGTPWMEQWFQTLRYRSTGGHGMHADQCSMSGDADTYWNGFVCELSREHCCAYRTQSALLYFNDFAQHELRGGDLYMVDRSSTDLLQQDEPSFSGMGLGHLLSRTVRLRPECGNLIMFASDTRNFHGTFAIEHGERYAMPLWFSDLSKVPTTTLQEHNPALYQETWRSVLRDLRYKCDFMNHGIFPVPSAFVDMRNENGDLECDAIVESVREMVGFEEDDEYWYGDDEDNYDEDEDEDEDDEENKASGFRDGLLNEDDDLKEDK